MTRAVPHKRRRPRCERRFANLTTVCTNIDPIVFSHGLKKNDFPRQLCTPYITYRALTYTNYVLVLESDEAFPMLL